MKRILIIEDDKSQQLVYQYWFSDHSLVEKAMALKPAEACPRPTTRLDLCDNLSDAFKLVKQNDYDIILLDLHLGESESGLYFLQDLKLKSGKPKIIVVSAYFSSLEKLSLENRENLVCLDKEEATQERLMLEMELKENNPIVSYSL